MKHLGDYNLSAVIYGKFATYRPSSGATFTLGGSPALSVYKDSSTTQSTSGVTLTVDFDGVTGLNHLAIDTSSDGTFYSAGSNFDVVITTGTVDGVSVTGAVVASFTLLKTSSGDPWNTTLPAAYASGKAGYILGTNLDAVVSAIKAKTDPLTFTVSNQVDANTKSVSGTAQTAHDLGAGVLLSVGTGTGQVLLVSGRIAIQSNTVTNVALPDFTFAMVDSAGIPRTGLAVTGFRVIDGGAMSSISNSVTEISNGLYKTDLTNTDLNGAVIALRFVATGAQDRLITVIMVP